MARLLVIGGSGFFGKSILDSYQRGLLRPFGIESISVMARNAQILKSQSPELLDQTVSLVDADISRCLELPKAEYVIYAAASTNAQHYIDQPDTERLNILAGAYNFCKLAQLYCRDSKIIFTSSGAVYGQQPQNLSHVSEDFDVNSLCDLAASKREYAQAKRKSEVMIKSLGLSNLNVSIARCFAFIGAYLPRNQSFAVGNFIEDGLSQRPIKVITNSTVYRSYMHADDLVRWLMTIADNSSNTCPIYNVGSDEPILIGDLAKKIGEFFNVPLDVPIVSTAVTDRYIPCINRAKELLNLRMNFSLDEAIYHTISLILKEKYR